jgi:dCMP deaminase
MSEQYVRVHPESIVDLWKINTLEREARERAEQVRQEKWDKRFLNLAAHISQWSKDPSTKVGAVLVNYLQQVVGMGYNGFARGVADTDERLNNRELKYKLVVHAEVNAILQAGHAARGSMLYVYPSFMIPPICHECCKAAIQAGVLGIVGFEPDETDPRVLRWKDSIAISKGMWEEAGLVVRTYKMEETK